MSRKEVLDPVTMEDFMQVCLPPPPAPCCVQISRTSCRSSQNVAVWKQSSLMERVGSAAHQLERVQG